jgi:hypothetical protein
MSRFKRSIPALAALVAVAVVGCGGGSSSSKSNSSATPVNPNGKEVSPSGDIPDNQAYVAYSPPGGGYSVKVPEGWARTDSSGAVTFTDKLNSIRMESMSATSAPTPASYKRDEAPKIASSVKGYKASAVSTAKRKAGTAVRAVYFSTSQPDAVTGKVSIDVVERYEFFKGGKEVVLTLTGPKGADNVDPWKIVTDSLVYTR